MMSSSSSAASTTTVLYTFPAAFKLPSADPFSLAAECALRFSRSTFSKKVEFPVGVEHDTRNVTCRARNLPRCVVSSPPPQGGGEAIKRNSSSSVVVSADGYLGILRLLERNNKGLDAQLSDEFISHSVCMTEMILSKMFGAIEYFCYGNDALCYDAVTYPLCIRPYEFIFDRWYTPHAFQKKKVDFLHSSFGFLNTEKAVAAAEDCLIAMERLYLTFQSQKRAAAMKKKKMLGDSEYNDDEDGDEVSYFFGTSSAASIDCLVYTSVSFVLHAVYPSNSKVSAWQASVRTKIPQLTKYAERIRKHFFEEYAGLYSMRPVVSALDDAEAMMNNEEMLYAPGRLRAVLSIATFSFLYFIVANAGTIASLMLSEEDLEALGNDDDDDGGGPSIDHVVEEGDVQQSAT